MPTQRNRFLLFILSALLCVLGSCIAIAQTGNEQAVNPGNGYRVAGIVASKIDGHPLARARVVLIDVKNPKQSGTRITTDDGRFEFKGLPAGKYSLRGLKKGFITAAYDQHDFFSTAIVTGAGLDTENLTLKLAPAAIIAGRVLDEAGEPVRHAMVALYYDNHQEGVDQIQRFGNAQTDDLGAYEMTPLMPGTYFLSANAKPWYAVQPRPDPANSEPTNSTASDSEYARSLDVAYPTTYYADALDPDSATPIPVRGGERLEVDIHLNPVPALRVLMHLPDDGRNGYAMPLFEQPAFSGSSTVQGSVRRMISPGVVEITGIPAGRYDVHLQGQGTNVQINNFDVSKDGHEIDSSAGEALSMVKVTAKSQDESSLPPQLSVGLRSRGRTLANWKTLDSKGEADIDQIPAGRYEVLVWGARKPFFIARLSAEGAEVAGHSVVVKPGSTPSLSIALTTGSVEIGGAVKRAGKPFAGAMVVLVPKNPDENHDLFRRDQTDLDGTFSLRNVVPGSYTILALENGWDLDWSQPAVIAAYAKHRRTIAVGGHNLNLSEAIELQSK